MKITKSHLRNIIKEELEKVYEIDASGRSAWDPVNVKKREKEVDRLGREEIDDLIGRYKKRFGKPEDDRSRTSFKRDGKSINEEEEGIVFHLPGTKEDLNLLLSIIKSTGGPDEWGDLKDHVRKLEKRIKDLLGDDLDRGNMSYEEQRADDQRKGLPRFHVLNTNGDSDL